MCLSLPNFLLRTKVSDFTFRKCHLNALSPPLSLFIYLFVCFPYSLSLSLDPILCAFPEIIHSPIHPCTDPPTHLLMYTPSDSEPPLLSFPHLSRLIWCLSLVKVSFENEDGIDSGGITAEWYLLLSRSFFDPNICLFKKTSTSGGLFTLDERSAVNESSLRYLTFLGRLMAKAIYDGRVVDVPMCTFLFKNLIGEKPDITDLEEVDKVGQTRWLFISLQPSFSPQNAFFFIFHHSFSFLSRTLVDTLP